MVVMTVDVGTSSVRALLFDARGRALPGSETRVEYRPDVRADGTAQVDAVRLERLVHRALTGTLSHAGRDEIAAVGVSTFWHGLVGLDRSDRPTTPLVLWADMRSRAQAERLRAALDPE